MPIDNVSSRRLGQPSISDTSTREELIAWLEWNDPNGVYSDEDCVAEWGEGEVMTLPEAQAQVRTVLRDA